MSLTAIHPAPVELIPALIEGLSSADRTELFTLAQGDPSGALYVALERSSYSFCYMLGESPAAIGGLIHQEYGKPSQVWMIASTPRLEHAKKSFLMMSRKELREIQRHSDAHKIITAVDCRWRKSIRWLKWLGAKFGEPIKGKAAWFRPFEIRKR